MGAQLASRDDSGKTLDAASSIITIVGTKLAGKEPDMQHPFGCVRIRYFGDNY